MLNFPYIVLYNPVHFAKLASSYQIGLNTTLDQKSNTLITDYTTPNPTVPYTSTTRTQKLSNNLEQVMTPLVT